jgi:PcfJ-like protein
VSPAERFVRHHKQQTDTAISQAYVRLPRWSLARAKFDELLDCVRQRSARLLSAPVGDGRHPGIEALINLSRFAECHARPASAWPGSNAGWQGAVTSLARHLLARYPVPGFLGAAWYATDGPYPEDQRRWFVAHGAGARFRTQALPVQMTRRMEDIFLATHDHVGIECAMRRAEILALGGSNSLVAAILGTRLGTDLTNSEFWRTVWMFLIANQDAIVSDQVGLLIDFLHSIRHERVVMETPTGLIIQEPPQPHFSMKGRTPRSLLRLMSEWHRRLGLVTGGVSWEPSRLGPLFFELPRQIPGQPFLRWEITELTSSEQLRAEGAKLRHCVARYSHYCWLGRSSIWSLRLRCDSALRSVATVEVDLARRRIVQARGFRDRPASRHARGLIQIWAGRERLRMAT